MTIIIPAVLSTKQCHDYVGGSRIWEELQEKHGSELKPIRRLPRGDSFYRRETVDHVLRAAEATGSLLHPVEERPILLERQGRRYKAPRTTP
jgi:hypothetical protein